MVTEKPIGGWLRFSHNDAQSTLKAFVRTKQRLIGKLKSSAVRRLGAER